MNRPRVGPRLVPRQRLLDCFEDGTNHRVTLVSAPAGYGKTTAVNLWLETVQQPYAWLSLDEYDSNLAGFAYYLVAALRKVDVEFDNHLSNVLKASATPDPLVLANLFLKDLESHEGPLIIVLDDYYLVRSVDVHAFLARVVQRLPAQIRMVLITRVDPPIGLARLRGRGELLEIRSADLRFTHSEVRELVQRLLDDAATDEMVQLLEERTEGWAVGLRLATVALRESTDRIEFARRFARSSHRTVIEYLLSEEQYSLALRTSILSRFCAPLCDVLAESIDLSGHSQRLIDMAWQSNLFLVALDAEGVWYRYHHLLGDLLRQALTQRVSAEAIAELHRRASSWFEANGLIGEAIIHAVRAGDVDRAERMVESNFDAALNQENWQLLERWMALMPEMALQRPGLLVIRAYLQHFRFNPAGLESLLDAAFAALNSSTFDYPEDEITRLYGHVHALRSNNILDREPVESMRDAMLARQLIAPEARFARSLAELFYGISLHRTGRTDEALEFFSDQLQMLTGRPDTRAFRLLLGPMAIHYAMASLESLRAASLRLLHIAQAENNRLSAGWTLFGLGWTHYQLNELDSATDFYLQGINSRFGINVKAAIDCYTGLALTHQAQGHPGAAIQTATDLRKYLVELGLVNLMNAADALDLRLALERDDQAGPGRQWRVPVGLTLELEKQLAADPMMPPILVAVRAYLASGSDDSLASASDLLQQCRRHAESINLRRCLIEIGALEALLLATRGEEEAALDALRVAVLLAEPGGALRLIADVGPGVSPYLQKLCDRGVAPTYITRILAVYPEHGSAVGQAAFTPALLQPPISVAPIDSPAIVEELTMREIDVLRLLALGLTNKEIASELSISTNTVKKHTINLYQKLQVPNRQRAIRTARALGYLPQDR